MSILQLQEKTLQATLMNIEKERQEWAKKVQDEVKATEWAEAAKTKAVKDEVNRRLGEEVAAAKKAILEGGDVSSAIAKASEARKKDEQATYEAQKAVRDFYGIKLPGETQNVVRVDELNRTITSFAQTVKDLIMPVDKAGRTVLDPYQPLQGDKVIPGQNLTISVPVTVSVNGMDAQSAQQLGEMAAKQIIPAVQAAVKAASTQYGGTK